MTLNQQQIDKLFPFHFLVNENFDIVSCGPSLHKIIPAPVKRNFKDVFLWMPLFKRMGNVTSLKELVGKEVVLETNFPVPVSFLGEFDVTETAGQYVFFGSPRFENLEKASYFGLSLRDFSSHDSQLDYLQRMKMQWLVESELKEKLEIIASQREKLRETSQELHSLALFPLQYPDPILRIDKSGKPLMKNNAAERIKTILFDNKLYSSEEFWRLIVDDIGETVERKIYEINAGGHWYSLYCQYIPETRYYNISSRDITQQKNDRYELQRLSMVAKMDRNAILITDVQGRITWANEGLTNLTQYQPEEYIGKTPIEICAGELSDKDILKEIVSKFSSQQDFDFEIIHYRKDRSTFWGRTRAQSVKSDDGTISMYFSILEDITEKKATEERLKLLSQIAAQNSTAIVIADATGKFIWVNQSFIELTGYTFEEAYNKTTTEFIGGPGSNAETIGIIRKTVIEHGNFEGELQFAKKNGDVRWIHLRVQALYNDKKEYNGSFSFVEDITEKKRSKDVRELNEAKYRGIISNMSLGLLEVDVTEKIVFANQSFSEMSGWSINEIIGMNARDLLASNTVNKVMDEKNKLRAIGVSDAYEIEVNTKSGEKKWWLISGAPRYDEGGNLIGSIGIHLDITKQKNLEAELKSAKEEAEDNVRSKELFLANMSHEIRTPMNGIMGMVRQLEKSNLDEKQRFYTDTIHSAASNLLVILNDILDLSRVEAGKLSLENIGFNLKDTIERSINVLSPRAQEKGLEVKLYWDDEIAPVLIGDPYRINQVLLNIVGNSIKFTEKGSVHVICRRTAVETENQSISISVIDTGIGMDEVFLSKLFENFAQEEKSTSRRYGGTGLGMSISKQLIELMGGAIHVTSKKGEGTTVRLEVQLRIGAEKDLPANKQKNNTVSLQGLRILVVEDNELNRLVVSTALKNEGCIITETVNGMEAIEQLIENTFDIILMDVQMPVLDGIKATKFIRNEIKSNIPIVALTANAIKGENEKCLEAGMNDYLAKPFEEDDLFRMIQNNVSGNREVKPTVKESKIRPSAEQQKLYDLQKLYEIGRGDDGFVTKMIKLFSESIQRDIQEIETAYAAGNFTIVKKTAHRIKPSIDNMGIRSLYSTIRAVENMPEDNSNADETIQHIRMLKDVVNTVIEELQSEMPQSNHGAN